MSVHNVNTFVSFGEINSHFVCSSLCLVHHFKIKSVLWPTHNIEDETI